MRLKVWENRESRPVSLLPAFALMTILILGGAVGLSDPVDPDLEQKTQPLPFDPPTDTEREAAARIAESDPSIQADLGARYVVTGVALATGKQDGGPVNELTRLLDVWFYDYTSDRVVWAVVDPAREEVTDRVDVDFPYQPPLADIEIERAKELALGLEAVTDRFPQPLPVTAMLVSGATTVCEKNRCVVLAFIEDAPVMDHLVLVNLSKDKAISVLPDLKEVYRS